MDNKLIAEFMGEEFMEASLDGNDFYPQFHTSWDWLMPVIDKIYSLDSNVDFFKTININNTYNEVVQFINEYNNNNGNN